MKTKQGQILGIYLIEINNHQYIGQSVNISKRWGTHLTTLKNRTHGNRFLQKLYNKYGENSLKFSVLKTLDMGFVKSLNKKQVTRILTILEQAYFNLYKPDINFCPAAGSRLGSKSSEEQKEKMADSLAQSFYLVSPSGEVFEGKNVRKFSRLEGVDSSGLNKVRTGERLHYKGWTSSLENHRSYLDKKDKEGLTWNKKRNHWVIKYKGKYLGSHPNLEEAKNIRDRKTKELKTDDY